MSISTTIKTIQDIMRKDAGVDGDAQRINQLVWMIFLKVFDAREEEYELLEDNYQSPIPEGLRWRNWAADSEGITGDGLLDFVDNALFKTLKELRTTATDARGQMIGKVFEDAYNYMKNGTLIRQVINKLNEVDFNKKDQKKQFSEIYEKILKDLQSAGNAGEYYTPRAVTKFIVDRIKPQLGEIVFDPACGTGGFLTAAIDYIRQNFQSADVPETLQRTIRGTEKKPLPFNLCVTNLILHGIDVPSAEHDNTLARPLRDYSPHERVDVIITNPPFGGMEEDGIEDNFPATFRTRETADLFLVLIAHLLKEGGRGAIVLPDGTLFGEGVKTRIKEKLLQDCNLHTIVRLPNGVFNPYTSIKTNLLFFTKGEPTERIWYYEHPYPAGYKSYSKTKPIRFEEFAPEQEWWDNREKNEFAWQVSIADLKANNYNIDIKNPHKVDVEHADLDEMLAEHQKLMAELGEVRSKLKFELIEALEIDED
ncbi:SAM-dependent DNA methyltransferase [Scytonema hofmannii FACHB-248]|uniref:site-specific DNA-methyltransferase (adenine-specific) n=1 Tax=Scytonema hofmannii FACHB-248 TaxID=1842502 RepID=A0ABR8GRD4_9CYAN|nr:MULTISPECIES: class I SAM-dependent DNA methyltransferase [Nostocales]MBD2605600.1 SAM-dependent DNA methyltransferase [Scytonema hofmannii FACHB-248]